MSYMMMPSTYCWPRFAAGCTLVCGFWCWAAGVSVDSPCVQLPCLFVQILQPRLLVTFGSGSLPIRYTVLSANWFVADPLFFFCNLNIQFF